MGIDAAEFVEMLRFEVRSALLAGHYPLSVSLTRTEMCRMGLIDQRGMLTDFGATITKALQSKPQKPRDHKYEAKACYVTPDLRIELATQVDRSTGAKGRVTPDAQWIRFDSIREARRWITLVRLERNGEISGLERQIRFPLYAGLTDGTREPISTYIADFQYRKRGGDRVVEDAKGMKTRGYLLKRRWLKVQEGIEIREV